MKNFLAIYIGSEDSPAAAKWDALDEATRSKQEMAGFIGWTNWVKTHEQSLEKMGGPVGKTKLVNAKGVSDTKNKITAYTVVRAESHEAAAKMFLNHPHFAIFPGDSVEVMECLPIPQM